MDEKQAAYSSHQIAYVPGAIDEDVFKQAVLSKVAVWQGRYSREGFIGAHT